MQPAKIQALPFSFLWNYLKGLYLGGINIFLICKEKRLNKLSEKTWKFEARYRLHFLSIKTPSYYACTVIWRQQFDFLGGLSFALAFGNLKAHTQRKDKVWSYSCGKASAERTIFKLNHFLPVKEQCGAHSSSIQMHCIQFWVVFNISPSSTMNMADMLFSMLKVEYLQDNLHWKK